MDISRSQKMLLAVLILSASPVLAFDGVMVAKAVGPGSNVHAFCAVGKLATGDGCSGPSNVKF